MKPASAFFLRMFPRTYIQPLQMPIAYGENFFIHEEPSALGGAITTDAFNFSLGVSGVIRSRLGKFHPAFCNTVCILYTAPCARISFVTSAIACKIRCAFPKL